MHQVVKELEDLIESIPELSKQANQMFEQRSEDHRLVEYPLDRPKVDNYHGLLEAIDGLLVRAPEYNDRDLGLIGLPFSAIINWPLGTESGIQFFTNPSVNAQIRKILKQWTEFLSSSSSSYVLNETQRGWFCDSALDFMLGSCEENGRNKFERLFLCDPMEKHWGFKSFDDYFTRSLRFGVRRIASPTDWNVITHPCEASPFKINTAVQARDWFWIKGQRYSLQHLLAGHPSTASFIGGTIYQGFLQAGTYHRWHSPVDGYIKEIKHQPGTYFTKPQMENYEPSDPIEWQAYIAQVATRVLIFIEADNPDIGLMCLMPVGWAEVSSCEATVEAGQYVKKGDQVGMFHFGGSTHCLIFRHGVELDFDLHGQTAGRDSEAIPVNSCIATVKHKLSECRGVSWVSVPVLTGCGNRGEALITVGDTHHQE